MSVRIRLARRVKMIEQDKINWIEINLPWYSYIYSDNAPQMPDTQDLERSIFGSSIEDLREKIQPDLEEYRKLTTELKELQDIAAQKAIDAGILYSDCLISPEYLQIEVDFWNIHGQDPCVIARKTYIELKDKINTWIESQPVWLEYQVRHKAFVDEQKQKSFTGRGLAMPGTLVEMEDGSIEMIGSINTSGGVCNDCMAFDDNMIVKRYAVVYPFIRKKASDDES